MQKYKIVASKSQKKYTVILSADSETEAKEKLHKDGYSVLSISKLTSKDIDGQKFLFQVEKDGEIKNGVIIGKDIFKIYIKLVDELEYHVLSLYPEGDEAHTNSIKKQEIIQQLQQGYELQKKSKIVKKEQEKSEESFYLKKQLDSTYQLIDKVLQKFDLLFNEKQRFQIDDITFSKLQDVYEKLIHIKNSTNLGKLKEIGELALIKIAQIELQSLERIKDQESRDLLKHTNELLKKIGSTQQFKEHNKDIKKRIQEFFKQFEGSFSFSVAKEKKEKKVLLDADSYSFLKTVLLLEKYQEKLSLNTREIQKNITLFLNPFTPSEKKEKILLKRKVIKQNISILKAKKTGNISSYTGVKRGYYKIADVFFGQLLFLGNLSFICVCLYSFLFLFGINQENLGLNFFFINTQAILFFLLFFLLFFIFSLSRNLFIFSMNIVFFGFIFIFSVVNF